MLLHSFLWPSEKESAAAWIRFIDRIIDKPDYLVMKVIDTETNEIAAFAIWHFIKYPRHENTKSLPESLDTAVMMPWAIGGDNDSSTPQDKLSRHIKDNFIRNFIEPWCNRTQCMYVHILLTDPRFQRRGYGTALMNYGHVIADKDRVPLFLIATPVGHPLYSHLGWKEVSTGLAIDMRKWVPGAENGDQGWGVYRYYYMLRLPYSRGLVTSS